MSRVPRIRFKGFEEDWEQRKFVELFLEKRDKTQSEDEDVLLSCAITGIYLNSELFSHFRGTSNIGYLKIKKNDLILSAQNLHLGNANVNLLFEHGIISPAYKVYELNECDQYFVQSWVKKDSTKDFFLNATTEGASQCRKNIDWCILNNQLIVIPSLYEQVRIGKLFNSLNHLITLHQRKLEKLKIIKKSMLENLFPQNGEKTPKIRFSGFTKDWEQRKLGEVFVEYSEKNHSELPPLTIIQGGGTIRRDESDRALQYDKGSLSNYKMVNKGDFIVHLRSFEGGLEKANSTGIISPAYHTLSGENTDTTFYYAYFRSKKFIESDLKPHVYGIRDGRSIDIEGMKTINIPYTILEEQRRIGKFIDSLDHLITLHQSKSFGHILKVIVSCTLSWEQRKLGEIADKVVEKNFQLQERDVFTNSAEFGIIDQKDFFDHEIVNKNNIGRYYIVSPNDFVYNPRISVTAPVGPINRNKLCKRGIMSPLYTVFHPRNMNEIFLEFFFKTNKWHKFMEYNGDSGARSDRFSIKTELFYAMTIPFPSHEEQSKVGICFDSLDHLITLHQLEPFQLIFKAIAYRIIDYAKSKPPRHRK